MISRLRGIPAGRTVDGLVVDVGGVGYLVSATPAVLRRADGASEVTVETYLHVREDALQLYGFADAAERALFVQLLGVSGIGPKVALGGRLERLAGGAPTRDRDEGLGALPGDSGYREEDCGADRARARGLARGDGAASRPGRARASSPLATRWSSSATRSSRPSMRLPRSIPTLPVEERVRERSEERRVSSQFLAPALRTATRRS